MHRKLARGLREGGLLLAAAVAVYLLLALASFSPIDPTWSHLGTAGHVRNLGGIAGAWSSAALLTVFGTIAYALPLLALYGGLRLYRWGQNEVRQPLNVSLRSAGLIVLLLSACGLAAKSTPTAEFLPYGNGGLLGELVGHGLAHAFGHVGSSLILLTLLVITLPIVLSFSWLWLMDAIGSVVLALVARVAETLKAARDRQRQRRKLRVVKPAAPVPPRKPSRRERRAEKARRGEQLPLAIEPEAAGVAAPRPVKPWRGDLKPQPPIELLDEPRGEGGQAYSAQELERMSADLERHLSDFGVQVKVVAAQPGPVITRFEVEPAPGVKVSQISNLAKDLARALSVLSVRVVEIIPGKSVMGLEIPNAQREVVALSEIIRATQYGKSASPLTLALGKDIGGTPVVADLSRMPHLLVAGTTGSGKSVAVNAMILSMIYKAGPEDVRFIMIDPKMLELSVYEGIPHLLAPVVTDMKEAANALRWCVAEMERRYRLMATLGVRNIAGYNRKVMDAEKRGEPISDPLSESPQGDDEASEPAKLGREPQIVVIVDELADMMMVVGKKVEELIARLAQKARAAGIHLILATQRPSVDVITGLIKANIPTRMSFQVSSRVDSRTILDQIGAESLLGYGDMLYLPPGTGMPQRVHGAFVDDHEVHQVVAYLKQLGEPEYVDSILNGESEAVATDAGGDDESDPLYDQAVNVVIESRKASISYVQRRLRVGYNRAARLVEQMERSGLVGPLQSNGSREVLVPPSD